MKLILKDYSLFYNKKEILKGINSTFESGKLNLIVGRSGCGKSSLLSAIAGFHNEILGKILLDGEEFHPDGNFALAFQNPENLFFNSTVLEEISFALLNFKYTSQEAKVKSFEWMSNWDLSPNEYAYMNPLKLSGGEKRRVALAACTVFLPKIIMLDEPLAGLDIKRQILISKLLNDIAKDKCIIIVTHEPEILLKDNSNVLYINNNGIGENYTGKEFILKAINDEEFYPLPRWFRYNPHFED